MKQVESVTKLKRLQSQIERLWGMATVRRSNSFNSLAFGIPHLVIPSSLDIHASSFCQRMFVSRHGIGTQKKIVDVSHSE
jgi:hypothetical protein